MLRYWIYLSLLHCFDFVTSLVLIVTVSSKLMASTLSFRLIIVATNFRTFRDISVCGWLAYCCSRVAFDYGITSLLRKYCFVIFLGKLLLRPQTMFKLNNEISTIHYKSIAPSSVDRLLACNRIGVFLLLLIISFASCYATFLSF